VKFERLGIKVEEKSASVTPIGVLAEKQKLKVESVECYSKNWEKKTLIPFS